MDFYKQMIIEEGLAEHIERNTVVGVRQHAQVAEAAAVQNGSDNIEWRQRFTPYAQREAQQTSDRTAKQTEAVFVGE